MALAVVRDRTEYGAYKDHYYHSATVRCFYFTTPSFAGLKIINDLSKLEVYRTI